MFDLCPCPIHAISDGDSISVLPTGALADTLRHKFSDRIKSGNHYRRGFVDLDRPIGVRFFGIDAMEKDQPGGAEAHARLVQLLEPYRTDGLGLIVRDIDIYGRVVADVWADGFALAPQLLSEGNCVIYRKYLAPLRLKEADIYHQYSASENAARNCRRGFWGLPEHEQVLPYEWRQRKSDRSW
jgi:endonuclease YncB( thermonuclease family)